MRDLSHLTYRIQVFATAILLNVNKMAVTVQDACQQLTSLVAATQLALPILSLWHMMTCTCETQVCGPGF